MSNLCRQLLNRAIRNIQSLELLEIANFGRQTCKSIDKHTVIHIVLANGLLSAHLVDNLRLAILLVESCCRYRIQINTLLQERTSTRLRHLNCRVYAQQICTLIIEHIALTLGMRTTHIKRRIVDDIRIVVGTKIQLYQLCELANSRRHIALEAEIAQIDTSNTAIRVNLNTRLLAPQIDILIEIPIQSTSIALTIVAPIWTIKALPNLVQCVVILDIFVYLVKFNIYIGICYLVVFDDNIICRISLFTARFERCNILCRGIC